MQKAMMMVTLICKTLLWNLKRLHWTMKAFQILKLHELARKRHLTRKYVNITWDWQQCFGRWDQPWIGVVQANEKNKGVAGLSKHSIQFPLDCAVSTLAI